MIVALTGGTEKRNIILHFFTGLKLPITSRTTEADWGWSRAELSAVQVTLAPWSPGDTVITRVLVTRPLTLSIS